MQFELQMWTSLRTVAVDAYSHVRTYVCTYMLLETLTGF